jgi:hypothetical protein
MESVGTGEAFNRAHRFALNFNGQNEARIDENAVQGHTAGTTIAVVTSFFRTSEPEFFAQHFKQTLTRLAEKLRWLTVDRALDVDLAHALLPFVGESVSASGQLVNCMTARLHSVGHEFSIGTFHCTDEGTLGQYTH